MNDTRLTFEPWADVKYDYYRVSPSSVYSRAAWLPVIGPSGWLLWGTLAAQLHRRPTVTWNLDQLAEAHGMRRGDGNQSVMNRTLRRLDQFRIFSAINETTYLVRLSAPPVSARELERQPHIVELHQRTFSEEARNAS